MSGITQSVLAEPGSAQKAFSLLTYWRLNGLDLDVNLVANTVNQVVLNHEASGITSDISWALAFCLQNDIPLNAKAAQVLSRCDDDCVVLQALDMADSGLLPKGFSTNRISALLSKVDMDDEHWIIGYEAHHHGFLSDSAAQITSNPLFSDLLAKSVTFYRRKVPSYATVIHPGGAPAWVVAKWISAVREDIPLFELSEVARAVAADLEGQADLSDNADEAILRLLRSDQGSDFVAVLGAWVKWCVNDSGGDLLPLRDG